MGRTCPTPDREPGLTEPSRAGVDLTLTLA